MKNTDLFKKRQKGGGGGLMLIYDYWDVIIKFLPGSTKWNTPFVCKSLKISFF